MPQQWFCFRAASSSPDSFEISIKSVKRGGNIFTWGGHSSCSPLKSLISSWTHSVGIAQDKQPHTRSHRTETIKLPFSIQRLLALACRKSEQKVLNSSAFSRKTTSEAARSFCGWLPTFFFRFALENLFLPTFHSCLCVRIRWIFLFWFHLIVFSCWDKFQEIFFSFSVSILLKSEAH